MWKPLLLKLCSVLAVNIIISCVCFLSCVFFSRFIINIPEEERQDLIRIFFQIELAHWFYLDFYCAENPELKTCGIKDFSTQSILCLAVLLRTNVLLWSHTHVLSIVLFRWLAWIGDLLISWTFDMKQTVNDAINVVN